MSLIVNTLTFKACSYCITVITILIISNTTVHSAAVNQSVFNLFHDPVPGLYL
jgi:hypothetical protein